jgi:hypothetical protein
MRVEVNDRSNFDGIEARHPSGTIICVKVRGCGGMIVANKTGALWVNFTASFIEIERIKNVPHAHR